MTVKFDFQLEPGKINKKRYKGNEESALVSIITPYFNAGKYFEQTFNCVVNQTFAWFEWIIVNDGSTNQEDVTVLEQLAKQDNRVQVVHQENGGAVNARKHGIRKSKSNVIVFLDADDLIDHNFIEYLYWALERNPGAMWAYTDSLGFGNQEYLWIRDFNSERMKEENIIVYIAAIRKCVFEDDGIYDDSTKNMWEDYQFWLKMLAKGYYPVHVQLPMFWYRRHDTGELSRIERDPELKKQLQARIKNLAKKVPNDTQSVTFNGRRAMEFEKPHHWKWEWRLPFAEEKTQILMIVPHMECGGADKFNLDILKNIDKSKYEVGVITTSPARNDWRQQFCQYADDVFELPAFLDMNDWSAFIHYYIYSRDIKIVWNISSYYGYYILPWLRIQFPETAIIDCVHAEGRYWRAGGYPRVSSALSGVLDKTFVTNTFTRDIMAERYKKKEDIMQVIYTGIDETEFDPEKIDCRGLQEELGIAAGRPIVLYLCRIAAEKRPFLMLEIAKKAKKQIPGICFLCVGNGPQLEELQRKVRSEGLEGTVIVLGGKPDIRPYYKLSHLLLLCSVKEGLSITTMEAMAMEKPVVSADVGSQYELVTPQTGRLIPCRQDEAEDFDNRNFSQQEILEYVNALNELLGGQVDLLQMGKDCREKILNGFTISRLMDTLYCEFDRLQLADVNEKRKSLSSELSTFKEIVEDYLTLYITYEAKDREAAEIWAGREWYRRLYETENKKLFEVTISHSAYHDVIIESPLLGQSEAELRLKEIYSMRSWKIMKKYMNFMDNTRIGRALSKMRNYFRCFVKRV
jgi:glycosyltransferase involved in cell wall biosynthesis